MNSKPVPAGCGQNRWPERRCTEQPDPAEACSELLEEHCRPPFTRVGLVLILCSGIPMLVVIVWALVAWMPPA